MNKQFKIGIYTIGSLTVILSLSSLYLSKYFFIADLFSHFQLQFFFILLIITGGLIIIKSRKFLIIILLYLTFLIYFFIRPISLIAKNKKTKIFYINMNYRNQNPEIIYNEIVEENPNTVLIVEINEKMNDLLTKKYGKAAIYNNEKALSCAIFSKNEVKNPQIIKSDYPICYGIIDNFETFLVHPLPPLTPNHRNLQITHFKNIKKLINKTQKENKNFLLIGDFNSSYYSATFRQNFGEYFQKNYYSRNNFSPLMIPIDHALSNKDIQVELGKNLNSDHHPLYISY